MPLPSISPVSAPAREATFGAGGAEPYAHAIRRAGRLTLVGGTASADYDLDRWMAEADDADRALFAGLNGPVLDVGCGPGRMVQAAIDEGLVALGVDVSRAALSVARRAGLPVLRRSVFDRLPREGRWGTVLLIDGNIGIGGDPEAMLARCADLLGRHGSVVVEVQADDEVDHIFSAHIVDDAGRSSGDFPWAEVGASALDRYARAAGLELGRRWQLDGRTFCRLTARRG